MQYEEANQIKRERKAEAAQQRAAIIAAQSALFDEPDRNPRQYEPIDIELARAA
jgi:hypothetical protein